MRNLIFKLHVFVSEEFHPVIPDLVILTEEGSPSFEYVLNLSPENPLLDHLFLVTVPFLLVHLILHHLPLGFFKFLEKSLLFISLNFGELLAVLLQSSFVFL